MWRPGLPLFKNKYREAESALSDSKGAWAERVSSLFALILLQFHIPVRRCCIDRLFATPMPLAQRIARSVPETLLRPRHAAPSQTPCPISDILLHLRYAAPSQTLCSVPYILLHPRHPLGQDPEKPARRVVAYVERLAGATDPQAHVIQGYIKPLGSIPGTKLRLPNHAWNAVDIKGKWRLLDPAWASNPEAQLAFYTPPSEFVFTHLPLTQRWQLLGDPISVEDFWALPQLAPAFFPLGVAIPEEVPSLCETGTASLRLPMPRDTVPFPQLLELPGMEEVTPHPPGTKGVPPGSFVFAEVGAEASGEELTQWDITARLPEPSKDYCIRVVASRGSDPAVEIMMVRVSSPASGLDVGKVLPNYHDQWLRSRCRLLSPRPQEVLSPGQVVSFRIVVPGAVGGVAVGEPGGYQFELLERKDGDTYVGTVKVPENAVSLVVTTHSVENEGIYMPLLKWHLKSGMHR